MSKTEKPKISCFSGKDYTCVTFYPDLRKFGMTRMDDDVLALLTKRAYDLAGVTGAKVRVTVNDQAIKIKDFREYCDLYLESKSIDEKVPKIMN